jgi:hypothetical protein
MFRHITLLCIIFSLFSAGCEQREDPAESTQAESRSSTIPPKTTMLLQHQVELKRYEVPSQALQQWYKLRAQRPALLLYSNDPFLIWTRDAIQKNLVERLKDRDLASLRFDTSSPAILPRMTVHAALELGLFSAVYWVMPLNAEVSALSVETFRSQMMQNGVLDIDEARTLTLRDGVFSGTVRGIPFHALHPSANFAISGPTVVHFDLSFLAPLYKGEIKTPIYPLIYQTLKHLRDQKIEAIAATFSYSQISGEVALGSRFIGAVTEQLFKQPGMLDERLPEMWKQSATALYLPELFSAGEAYKILLQQMQAHPDDPSIHYALYQASRNVKSARNLALVHLAEAVKYDPVYALEYLALAPLAREKDRPDEALRLMQLAHDAAPNNPFITLELAKALIINGQNDNAVPLLMQLLTLKWSPAFYSDMPDFLQQLLSETKS